MAKFIVVEEGLALNLDQAASVTWDGPGAYTLRFAAEIDGNGHKAWQVNDPDLVKFIDRQLAHAKAKQGPKRKPVKYSEVQRRKGQGDGEPRSSSA